MHKPDQAFEDSTREAEKLGYETRDISIPTLIRWAGGLVIFVAASSIFAFLCYTLFTSSYFAPPNNGPITRVAVPEERHVPEGTPVLQANPVNSKQVDSIKSFRQLEEMRLEGYGKDKDGSIHIPVERAMEILVKQGLPVQASGAAPTGVKPTPDMQLNPQPAPPLEPPTPGQSQPPIRERQDTQGGPPPAGFGSPELQGAGERRAPAQPGRP